MGHPSDGLTGAVVAVYIAGEAVGALTQTLIGDKLGRIRYVCVISKNPNETQSPPAD